MLLSRYNLLHLHQIRCLYALHLTLKTKAIIHKTIQVDLFLNLQVFHLFSSRSTQGVDVLLFRYRHRPYFVLGLVQIHSQHMQVVALLAPRKIFKFL